MKWINRIDKYVIILIVVSVIVAFLIHFPELISLVDLHGGQTLFPGLRATEVMNEVFYALLSLLFLFWINTIVFKFNHPSANISWYKLTGSFFMILLLSNILGKSFVFLHQQFNIPAIDSTVHHYLHPLRDIVMAGIVVGSCYMTYLVRKSQLVVVENQQLRNENLVNQYESLKNQLNPHMLFNSLNTLRSLIRETPDKAQDYLQELSRVLRYTLQENDCQAVSLKDEMAFARAYIYLLKMRYEENLMFDIQIDPEAISGSLPPMSVQLLIENAVKHNEISNRRPLMIRIQALKDELMVYNLLQPKLTNSVGTRIGLSNLAKRYHLLYKKEITVIKDESSFEVRIPLMNENTIKS